MMKCDLVERVQADPTYNGEGCNRGAPYDPKLFHGADKQCSACWQWQVDRENSRKFWSGQLVSSQPNASTITIPPSPQGGPGTELKKILEELGIEATSCAFNCAARAALMDSWGIEGCKENREDIITWLKQNAKNIPFAQRLVIKAKGLKQGFTSFGSLVDEAIRRADIKAKDS